MKTSWAGADFSSIAPRSPPTRHGQSSLTTDYRGGTDPYSMTLGIRYSSPRRDTTSESTPLMKVTRAPVRLHRIVHLSRDTSKGAYRSRNS